jgi:hypothetical protein
VSDSAQVIVRIDKLPRADREHIAGELARWLLACGVIAELDRSDPRRADDLLRRNWGAGPNWRDVVDHDPGAVFETLLLSGVDINAEVGVHSAYGNAEDWRCLQCGSVMPGGDLINEWLQTKDEPVATCAACAWSAWLVDWPAEFPLALVGAPAITFHNWQPLRSVPSRAHRAAWRPMPLLLAATLRVDGHSALMAVTRRLKRTNPPD